MIEKAPQMTGTTRAEEEIITKELRGDLDSLLEWQADYAPKALVEQSIREGLYPRREGNIMDALYTHQYFADDEDVKMGGDDEIPLEKITDYYEAEMDVEGSE
jgi:hypothetical protein